ncbi:MAG: hypothetical protein QUS14_01045 [Pyrinomonadaceae bacterium]|nr:hypothetical protein [Pyrinomonadaceae bacterium]
MINNGFLPQLAELYNKKSTIFTRRNGLIFTLFWFLFFLFIMTPFWGIMDVDELAVFSAILAIFGSLILLLVSMLILKKAPVLPNYLPNEVAGTTASTPASLYGSPVNQQALPPQQSEPVQSYAPPAAGAWRAPDTGEFANRPGSVVENTTKLLERDEKS